MFTCSHTHTVFKVRGSSFSLFHSSQYGAAPRVAMVMVMVPVMMVGRVVMVWEGLMVMVVVVGMCEGRRVEVVMVTVVMVVMPMKQVISLVVDNISLVPQVGGGSEVAVVSFLMTSHDMCVCMYIKVYLNIPIM